MERNHFKERCEVCMAALGLSLKELCDLMGAARQRVCEALRGDNSPAASTLRVKIDQKLTGLTAEKREQITAELEKAREIQCPHLTGKLSVILPEDMIYIVTEDGIPKGAWNPQTKTYRELDAVVLPVVGRKIR